MLSWARQRPFLLLNHVPQGYSGHRYLFLEGRASRVECIFSQLDILNEVDTIEPFHLRVEEVVEVRL